MAGWRSCAVVARTSPQPVRPDTSSHPSGAEPLIFQGIRPRFGFCPNGVLLFSTSAREGGTDTTRWPLQGRTKQAGPTELTPHSERVTRHFGATRTDLEAQQLDC